MEKVKDWVGPDKPYEEVDHPDHYNNHPTGIEAIDIIEEMPFNVGTAMKYLWRAGLKPGATTIKDLEKAAWYVKREIERLEVAAGDSRRGRTILAHFERLSRSGDGQPTVHESPDVRTPVKKRAKDRFARSGPVE